MKRYKHMKKKNKVIIRTTSNRQLVFQPVPNSKIKQIKDILNSYLEFEGDYVGIDDIRRGKFPKQEKGNRITGNKLRYYREKAGLSQAELSRKSGVSRPNIVAMELGRRNMGTKVALKLSKYLEIDAEDLI